MHLIRSMLFNSYVFILLFFPLCLIGYYGLNYLKKYDLAQLFLLIMSLWFYAYFNMSYLLIILASICFNFFIYKMFDYAKEKTSRIILLLIGVICNVGVLFYFKYMDFFIENINILFNKEYALLNIMLPLGISFFTFQQLSFVIDAYHGEIPKYNFLHYASFVTFFPQLIAGPIVTHDELVPQFMDETKKKIDWDNFSRGAYIFALGMSKKVLLADTFGQAVSWGYANYSILDSTNAILVMLGYTFQIYFDFSGYCDMAIGIGKMFNVELPINFNSPYKAFTILEFWDRWHMTLTRFFTKYIYIPLGGNRKGEIRTYINIFIVFLVSGFWHGASWGFVFWGICHGLFSIINRALKGFFSRLHPALNWIITFAFVNVMWVYFRAESFSLGTEILNIIAKFNFGPIRQEILNCFRLPEIAFVMKYFTVEEIYPYFVLIMFYVVSFIIILGCKNAYEKMQSFKYTFLNVVLVSILLVWCVFSFSGISTFLYFNF